MMLILQMSGDRRMLKGMWNISLPGILGRLKNLIIIKTKTTYGKILVTSYSTNPKPTFTAYDLNIGLIDKGYNISPNNKYS